MPVLGACNYRKKYGDRTMATVGYERVLTRGQDLALQHEALKAAGSERIYAEKISGARSDRPQLARMLKALGPGDTAVVTRLDHHQGWGRVPLAGGLLGG